MANANHQVRSSSKAVAVVLCGSGYKDGSEIRESVSLLLALNRQGARFQCFAPDDEQADVVNCLTGEAVAGEKRNMLVEAARIARGDVLPLGNLAVADFDAVILPGGFGAAKNLCTFAFQGSAGSVRSDLQGILQAFHQRGKAIGAVCIAPAVIALAFKDSGFTLTVGQDAEAAQELKKLGHQHEVCPANRCVVDAKNRIVTTPAYMYDNAPMSEVFDGIEAMVKEVLRL